MIEKILNPIRKIIPKKLFRLGQPVYHFLLALSGNMFYRFPGRKLICIGITGTNGKSTTAELVNSILKASGAKTGLLSTIAVEIAGERVDNTTNRTSLGRWQTPRYLRKMVKSGCRYAVIEVASEGIIQYRTWGIPFDVAIFTNLTPEHLNTHKTMTNYRNAKGRLFANVAVSKKKPGVKKTIIVNADDKYAPYFNAFPAKAHFTYGLKKGEFRAQGIKQKNETLEFTVQEGAKKQLLATSLLGSFNVYNILAAYCAGRALGIEEKAIKKGLEAVKQVPGRMQEIKNKKGIRVFVDYAMTPDSYEMLFDELRGLTKGKLITVFGAAGERDRAKRPQIGEIAARKTDQIFLTDDEPYNEDPEKIIAEVEAGIKKTNFKDYKIIRDRKEALKKAILAATPGDVIVVPGMGHQKYRNIGGNKKIAWDEAKIISELLK